METLVLLAILGGILFVGWQFGSKYFNPEPVKRHEPEEIEETPEELYGYINKAMICPHCQTKGEIRTKPITQKKGIDGGKAAGAVLTAGISVLATGLSRTEDVTQAHCDNCDNTWFF